MTYSLRCHWLATPFLLAAVAQAQPSDRLRLDDFGRMSTPVATAVSPDGLRVAYTLVSPDSAGTGYVQSIRLVGATGGASSLFARRGSMPRGGRSLTCPAMA